MRLGKSGVGRIPLFVSEYAILGGGLTLRAITDTAVDLTECPSVSLSHGGTLAVRYRTQKNGGMNGKPERSVQPN